MRNMKCGRARERKRGRARVFPQIPVIKYKDLVWNMYVFLSIPPHDHTLEVIITSLVI